MRGKQIGVIFENGIVRAKEFIADKITAKLIRTDSFEVKDDATGEIYCVKIKNGDWDKTKGECGSQTPQSTLEPIPEPSAAPELSESPIPEPIPELTPESAPTPSETLTPESIPESTPTPTFEPSPEPTPEASPEILSGSTPVIEGLVQK